MTKYAHLKLKVLKENFKYVLFETLNDATSALNKEAPNYPYALFVSAEEVSAILPSTIAVRTQKEEPDWICMRIIGEMPFGTVQGLIAEISSALMAQGLGLCVVSTFKTDWFFVKAKNLDKAKDALVTIGWEFIA
jgi:hypothetical protein